MVEFALVIPILLVLFAGIIEFSHVLFARSILNDSAEAALELATVVHGLERPGVTGVDNDLAAARVRYQAMQAASVHFKHDTSLNVAENIDLFQDFPVVSTGRRITQIDLDIGEIADTGSPDFLEDLSFYLNHNPIVVSLEAEVPGFFSFFFGNWTLSSDTAGFRESRFTTNTARLIDCNGNVVDAGTFSQPEQCPCLGDPDGTGEPRVIPGMFRVNGNCICIPPYQATPEEPPPVDCLCPGGGETTTGDINDCRCLSCFEQSPPWSGITNLAVQQNSQCECSCRPPFVLANSGLQFVDSIGGGSQGNFCTCPADRAWNPDLQVCECDLAAYTANDGPCPDNGSNSAWVDGNGTCRCYNCANEGNGNNCRTGEADGESCVCSEECDVECSAINERWTGPVGNRCACTCAGGPFSSVGVGSDSNPCNAGLSGLARMIWRGFGECACDCSDGLILADCNGQPCCTIPACELNEVECIFNPLTGDWEFPE